MENPSNNQTTVNGETYIVLDDYWISDKKQQVSVIPGRNENTPIENHPMITPMKIKRLTQPHKTYIEK